MSRGQWEKNQVPSRSGYVVMGNGKCPGVIQKKDFLRGLGTREGRGEEVDNRTDNETSNRGRSKFEEWGTKTSGEKKGARTKKNSTNTREKKNLQKAEKQKICKYGQGYAVVCCVRGKTTLAKAAI